MKARGGGGVVGAEGFELESVLDGELGPPTLAPAPDPTDDAPLAEGSSFDAPRLA